VDADDKGIFFCWIEIRGIEQPALDGKAVAGVVDGLGVAPCRLDGVVEMGDLPQVVGGAGPDLGRVRERLADEGDVGGVGGE
jgi:hypothetical protein